MASHAAASSAVRARYASSTDQPASASPSAVRVSRASACTVTPACLAASIAATLTFTNRTPGSLKAVCEAVVKSW